MVRGEGVTHDNGSPSWSEVFSWVCTNCQTAASGSLPVIVDGAEQPELVQRIADGTLHFVTCPRCLTTGGIPLPVLLYRGADGVPLLVFSPAPGADVRGTGVMEALLSRLRATLADGEAVGDPAIILPDRLRAMLALTNSAGPGAFAPEALHSLLQCNDWQGVTALIATDPDALGEKNAELLSDLAQVLLGADELALLWQVESLLHAARTGLGVQPAEQLPEFLPPIRVRALLQQLSRPGDRTDRTLTALARDLVDPDTHPLLAVELELQLAKTFLDEANEGVLIDAERTIELIEDASKRSVPRSKQWARAKLQLGHAWGVRFDGERGDNVEHAIEAYEEALTALDRDIHRAMWARVVTNLGIAFKNRERGDRESNLRASIDAFRQALAAQDPGLQPLEWAISAYNLGGVLVTVTDPSSDEFETTLKLLAQVHGLGTKLAQRGLARGSSLLLGQALLRRGRGDRLANLEHARALLEPICMASDALSSPGVFEVANPLLRDVYKALLGELGGDNARRADILNSLCEGAWTLHGVAPTQDTARTVIEVYNEVLDVTAPDDPSYWQLLIRRGIGREDLYDWTKDPEDLDGAIDDYRRAVELTGDDVQRAWNINSLALGLCKRFETLRESKDIELSVAMHREAVEAAPAVAALHGNLAVRLEQLFDTTVDATHLVEAAMSAARALDVAPLGTRLHTELASMVQHLRERLGERFSEHQLAKLMGVDVAELELARTPRAVSVHNFAHFMAVSAQSGRPEALDTAIGYAEANELYRVSDGYEPPAWLGLALASLYETRFERSRNPLDLDRLIEVATVALQRQHENAEPSVAQAKLRQALGLAMMNRSRLRQSRADALGAVEHLEFVAQNAREHNLDLAPRLTNLGNALMEACHYTGGLEHIDRAIECWREAVDLSSPNDAPLFIRLNNYGDGLLRRFARTSDLDDLDRAVELTRKSAESTPRGHRLEEVHFANLSGVLRIRFEVSRRLADIAEAVAVAEYAMGLPEAPRPSTVVACVEALLARYNATRNERDLHSALRATGPVVDSTPESSLDGLMARLTRATCLRLRHGLSGADADLEGAVASYEVVCREGARRHPEIGAKAGYAWTRWASDRRSWEEAARAAEAGLAAFEHLFQTQRRREHRESRLRNARGFHRLAAYVMVMNGNSDRAVEFAEQGRARLLATALESRSSDRLRHLLGDDVLVNRYEQALKRFEAAATDAPDLVEGGALRRDIDRANEELDAVVDAIRATPGGAEVFGSPRVKEIRSIVDAAGAAVVYLMCEGSSSLALVVTRDSVEAVSAPLSRAELRLALERKASRSGLAAGFLAAQAGLKPMWRELDALLPLLGDRLLGPVAEALARSIGFDGEVTLVPMGLLALLPLHAATLATDAGDACFGDLFSVGYSPSIATLAHAQRAAIRSACRTPRACCVAAAGDTDELGDLRYASLESSVVAACFGSEGTRYGGADATEVRVLKRLREATHIHFACHAVFDPEAPMESHIQLAAEERITLRTLVNQQGSIDARLAVLSACQTAVVDRFDLVDESVGLHVGFLQLGVAAVIGSLWPVGDLATFLLMSKFYELHMPPEGAVALTPRRALRGAQTWLSTATNEALAAHLSGHLRDHSATVDSLKRWCREAASAPTERPFEHPNHWAGFVAYGL